MVDLSVCPTRATVASESILTEEPAAEHGAGIFPADQPVSVGTPLAPSNSARLPVSQGDADAFLLLNHLVGCSSFEPVAAFSSSSPCYPFFANLPAQNRNAITTTPTTTTVPEGAFPGSAVMLTGVNTPDRMERVASTITNSPTKMHPTGLLPKTQLFCPLSPLEPTNLSLGPNRSESTTVMFEAKTERRASTGCDSGCYSDQSTVSFDEASDVASLLDLSSAAHPVSTYGEQKLRQQPLKESQFLLPTTSPVTTTIPTTISMSTFHCSPLLSQPPCQPTLMSVPHSSLEFLPPHHFTMKPAGFESVVANNRSVYGGKFTPDSNDYRLESGHECNVGLNLICTTQPATQPTGNGSCPPEHSTWPTAREQRAAPASPSFDTAGLDLPLVGSELSAFQRYRDKSASGVVRDDGERERLFKTLMARIRSEVMRGVESSLSDLDYRLREHNPTNGTLCKVMQAFNGMLEHCRPDDIGSIAALLMPFLNSPPLASSNATLSTHAPHFLLANGTGHLQSPPDCACTVSETSGNTTGNHIGCADQGYSGPSTAYAVSPVGTGELSTSSGGPSPASPEQLLAPRQSWTSTRPSLQFSSVGRDCRSRRLGIRSNIRRARTKRPLSVVALVSATRAQTTSTRRHTLSRSRAAVGPVPLWRSQSESKHDCHLGKSDQTCVSQPELMDAEAMPGDGRLKEEISESTGEANANEHELSLLTAFHLKKAKMMFLFTRYPNSSLLKSFFGDLRFERNNSAQLIKWFSNFREFLYNNIERFVRHAVAGGATSADQLHVTREDELVRTLLLHYNRDQEVEVPNEFYNVIQLIVDEFFAAIFNGLDFEASWKKPIYKIIARRDKNLPEFFKAYNCPEKTHS